MHKRRSRWRWAGNGTLRHMQHCFVSAAWHSLPAQPGSRISWGRSRGTTKALAFHRVASASVLRLKAELCRIEGDPVDQQRLIFGSHELDDFRTLGTYGIGVGSTIYLWATCAAATRG